MSEGNGRNGRNQRLRLHVVQRMGVGHGSTLARVVAANHPSLATRENHSPRGPDVTEQKSDLDRVVEELFQEVPLTLRAYEWANILQHLDTHTPATRRLRDAYNNRGRA